MRSALKYVDVGTAPGSFSCNRTLDLESASDKLIGAARIIEAAEASLPVSIYGMMVVPCTFVSRKDMPKFWSFDQVPTSPSLRSI